MPILPREPDIFPEEVLEESCAAARRPGVRWWAVYTLSRREKDLIRRLRAMQIAHYCPFIRKRTRSPGGRVRTSFVPLFDGYVFMLGTEDDRMQALTTNCIARCLPVPDGRELAHDLRQIRRLIESDAPLTPEARIEPGQRVRIKSGSLAGLEGMVIGRRGAERLLVAVAFLQKGASIQLEDYQVERID